MIGLTVPAGCVKTPTAPEPLPPLTGDLVIAVEASTVCRLPVSRYEWEVEGTATGTAQGSGVRATLPGGDNTVDLSVSYASKTVVNGTLTTRTALFGEDLRVTISAGARGTLTTVAGRGMVAEGVLNGTIALSSPGDRDNNTLGSCTAADHKWTLTPR